MKESKTETHPCFGQISISKFQGDSRFFGSDVMHHGGIILEISRAEVDRKLSTDWIFGKKKIVEVRMSPLQFAELITTGMNTSGVPCTIKSDESGRVEQADFKDGIDEFKLEYGKTAREASDILSDSLGLIEEVLSGKSVKKSDLKRVHKSVYMARQHIDSNIPFVQKLFNEHISKSISEAKASVENFIECKIRHLGVKSLKELAVKKLK